MSRALAAAIDLGVVIVMGGGVLLIVAGVRFFLSPVSFHWPTPSWALSLLAGAVLAKGYLTVRMGDNRPHLLLYDLLWAALIIAST